MTTLVAVDTSTGAPSDDSLGLLSALARLGVAPTAVVLEDVADPVVLAAHGAAAVVIVTGADPDAPADALADAMSDLAAPHRAGRWILPTTTVTTDAAAGAAVRLGAGLWWRLVGLHVEAGELAATQVSADAATTRAVTWATPWGIGLVRAHAAEPDPSCGTRSVPVERHRLVGTGRRRSRVVERRATDATVSGLADAEVVVAAGRGIGAPERLELVRELADLLGGAAGVSLPLVESGWAPRSMQVGQTGTMVAPRVYLAFGISGQIQHRIGMERSEAIIAVNTDPNAPIMTGCDLAVVADVADVLPGLVVALRGG